MLSRAAAAGAGKAAMGCYSHAPIQQALPARVPGAGRKGSMNPVHWLLDTLLQIYIWILIASIVLSWLVAFNVVNRSSPIVDQIGEFLYRATEPALRPIRNVMPNLGGIDISPMILIIIIIFVQRLLWSLFD
jgi:YggT family protein